MDARLGSLDSPPEVPGGGALPWVNESPRLALIPHVRLAKSSLHVEPRFEGGNQLAAGSGADVGDILFGTRYHVRILPDDRLLTTDLSFGQADGAFQLYSLRAPLVLGRATRSLALWRFVPHLALEVGEVAHPLVLARLGLPEDVPQFFWHSKHSCSLARSCVSISRTRGQLDLEPWGDLSGRPLRSSDHTSLDFDTEAIACPSDGGVTVPMSSLVVVNPMPGSALVMTQCVCVCVSPFVRGLDVARILTARTSRARISPRRTVRL